MSWTSSVVYTKQIYSHGMSSVFHSVDVNTSSAISWLSLVLDGNIRRQYFRLKNSARGRLTSLQLPSCMLWTCYMHDQSIDYWRRLRWAQKICIEMLVFGKLVSLEEVYSLTPFRLAKKLFEQWLGSFLQCAIYAFFKSLYSPSGFRSGTSREVGVG